MCNCHFLVQREWDNYKLRMRSHILFVIIRLVSTQLWEETSQLDRQRLCRHNECKRADFFSFLYKGKSFVLWISQNQYGSNTHFIFNTDFLSDFFSAFMLINLQVNSVSLNACLPQSKLLKRWVLNNWGKTEPVLKSQLIKKSGETSEFPPTKVKMNFFVLLHNSIYLASHISCLQYVSTM